MSEATPFLILGAERTGSNLLKGLLDSHRRVFVGGELFNPLFVADGHVPWAVAPADEAELAALRRRDPAAFLRRLFESAEQRGYRAVGFKLMYYHGDKSEAARDCLAADTRIRVIHIKRKNLLRRYLSEERARMTGVWARPTNADASDALPAVRLELMKCLWNLHHVETKQVEYGERFGAHETFEVLYEELAADPMAVAGRALEFLGMEPVEQLEVRHRKTGNDSLREAITNYDELKRRLVRWVTFFED